VGHAPPRPLAITTSPAPVSSVSPAAPSISAVPLASALPASTPTPAATIPSFALKTETLSNGDVELHFTNRGGGISEAILPKHKAEHEKRVSLNSPEYLPIGALVENPAAPVLTEYELTRESDAVRFKQTTADNITIRKKFFFPKTSEEKDNYLIELDVDLQNGGAKPYSNPGYFLGLGSAVPIHAKDFPSYTRLAWSVDGKAKGIDVGWFGASSGFVGMGQRMARPLYQENVANAEWVAVSNQFFTTLITPLTGKANAVWGRRVETELSPDLKVPAIEGALGLPGFELQPGQTNSARFQMWIGPKLYHRLARLEHDEAEIMNFGIFKLVSQFLLNFMNWLHSAVRDYGVAILVLTTIIRVVLWPLQSKANQSMRKTAVLGPKMQELREKYKDDPTRMNQEVMKLYKQYGINPVGGCLPMVIQIPIFFGLYQMLGQAVELRNQKFLWVPDLSQPDTVAHLPVLGWPINIIPLCMAATQIWLMAMTPKTGDATQRRVMMFTPLIFLFICYNFAAALALYYTAQNLFSILQFYQNKKQPMPTLEKVAPAGKQKRR
jgi:YidC/Oxa1 family membrane protein insertase